MIAAEAFENRSNINCIIEKCLFNHQVNGGYVRYDTGSKDFLIPM